MVEDLDYRLHEDLYALIVWAHSSCNRDLIHAVGELELSFNQLLLLEELRGRRRPPRIDEIAAMLNITKSGAGRVVDELARRGLVDREPDERDFRIRRVTITARGEETVLQLHHARLHGLERLARELDVDDKEAIVDALDILLERDDIAACRPTK